MSDYEKDAIMNKWRGILFYGGPTTHYDAVLTRGVAEAVLKHRDDWHPDTLMRCQQKQTRHHDCRVLRFFKPERGYEKGTRDTCGLVCRISPLAAFTFPPTLEEVATVGYYTHGGNKTSVFVAWLHVKCLKLLLSQHVSPDQLWTFVVDLSTHHDDPFLFSALKLAQATVQQMEADPLDLLFNHAWPKHSVVVFVTACWFAFPYCFPSAPPFSHLASRLSHQPKSVAKLAGELFGAYHGLEGHPLDIDPLAQKLARL